MVINNVNLDKLRQKIEAVKANPGAAKMTNRIEGAWNLEPDEPQFSATVSFEGGQMKLESEHPSGLGGKGIRPGAMTYCLFGFAACYATTYAICAAAEGIELDSLRITAESDMDLTASMGLGEKPIVQGVRINLQVKSKADDSALERVEKLAMERCPAIYCITNRIPVSTSWQRE
jgi:uncharacterized OsmC-like protein